MVLCAPFCVLIAAIDLLNCRKYTVKRCGNDAIFVSSKLTNHETENHQHALLDFYHSF